MSLLICKENLKKKAPTHAVYVYSNFINKNSQMNQNYTKTWWSVF